MWISRSRRASYLSISTRQFDRFLLGRGGTEKQVLWLRTTRTRSLSSALRRRTPQLALDRAEGEFWLPVSGVCPGSNLPSLPVLPAVEVGNMLSQP